MRRPCRLCSQPLPLRRLGERKIDHHRNHNGDHSLDGRFPVLAGNQVMSDDRRRGPRHVHKRFVDHAPTHKQIGAGRQDQGVENIRDHENGIQHNRETEEDRLVDLENLCRQ